MDNNSHIFSNIFTFLEGHRVAIACACISACGFLALKRYSAGGVCRSKAHMNGKTVLITGANTGIGKETARDLASRGARVLLACRNVTKAETAAEDIRVSTGNNNVVVYGLDLSSLTSVRQCAAEVLSKESRLDVLINNAGVFGTPFCMTEDGFEMHFGTNHLGHFLLTNLLMDLLKKSAPSRIVVVSARAHEGATINFDDLNSKKKYSFNDAYGQSKLANVLFTKELSKRLHGTKVTANYTHPGVVDTQMVGFKDNFNFLARTLLNILYYGLVKYLMKSAVQGAQTTIFCAVDSDLQNVSGKYFSDCAIRKEVPQAQDEETAAKLWKVSEEMVGLTQQ